MSGQHNGPCIVLAFRANDDISINWNERLFFKGQMEYWHNAARGARAPVWGYNRKWCSQLRVIVCLCASIARLLVKTSFMRGKWMKIMHCRTVPTTWKVRFLHLYASEKYPSSKLLLWLQPLCAIQGWIIGTANAKYEIIIATSASILLISADPLKVYNLQRTIRNEHT